MVKVKGIDIQKNTYEKLLKTSSPDTKKLATLMPIDDIIKLLPKHTIFNVRFTLYDTNTELANAIRRCLVDEIPTFALTFDLMKNAKDEPAHFITNFKTNDKFAFGKCDDFLKRINAIRIKQDINPEEWSLHLHIDNNSSEIIDIYSHHLKAIKKGKEVPINELMYSNYLIGRLRPKKYLHINKIYVSCGIGRNNANKYKYLANVSYKIDGSPLTRVFKNGKYVYEGTSCLNSNYSTFHLGYKTYGNISEATAPIKNACKILRDKLLFIQDEWKKIKENNISDKIILSEMGDIYIVEVIGGSYTLANLLSRYIYEEHPQIEFLTGGQDHIEKYKFTIKIKHPNYWKLFNNAIQKIIQDIDKVDKSF